MGFHLHVHAWYHYLLKSEKFSHLNEQAYRMNLQVCSVNISKIELLSVQNTHQQYHRANMNESPHETTMLKVAQTSKARTIQNSWASQIAYYFIFIIVNFFFEKR